MLSVAMLNVICAECRNLAILLSFFTLHVVMLSVIMLNVMAPLVFLMLNPYQAIINYLP